MSTSTTKGKLFLKEVLARLTGDTNEVKASQIARKAISAMEGQIAALKGKRVDDENNVENKEEALKNAIYPTTLFNDNQQYTSGIVAAQNALDVAKSTLAETEDSIQYFEELLANSIK